MNGRKLDAQQVELVGTALLRTHLLADGIEIAEPIRDRGIDLIAYLDAGFYKSVPLQVKASTEARFGVDRKYERFPDPRIVHIWNVREPAEAHIFCTTYAEAVSVADALGWTSTAAWKAEGYSTKVNQKSKGGLRVIDALAPFEVTAGVWHERLFGLKRNSWLPFEVREPGNLLELLQRPAVYEFSNADGVFDSGESGRVLIDLDQQLLWVRHDRDDVVPGNEPVLVFRGHHYVNLDLRPSEIVATRNEPGEVLTIRWGKSRV